MKKILIANRGEIALRIIRACRDLNIKTVAVHSTADSDAMHVRMADETVCIGPPSSRESYLNVQAIISAACLTGAEAVHPGFGFLSENATFAYMVEEHGMTFIGPKSEHITLMGDKITAKKTVQALGLPTVPGSKGEILTLEQAKRVANEINYPIIVKATGGGGGRGMKIAYNDLELSMIFDAVRREAGAAFGNDNVYIEKFLENPRHIEFQILADKYHNAIHLGERDCSIQRRHQKIWEEALSSVLSEDFRQEFGCKIANAISDLGYSGVGTLEFLYDDGQMYFIEMNTRIQVEHPITEMVTGIDLVREQILAAAGEKLHYKQGDVKFNGHAIECRINAENSENFTPSAGLIKHYHCPGGPGVRVDSAIYEGYRVPPYYDSLIAKLIVHAENRTMCLARLKRALSEYVINGIDTLIPLHLKLVDNEDIKCSNYNIHFLEKNIIKAL